MTLSLIDLRSDNACHPTSAMRRFMSEAPVGDDAFREDPTVRALEERVAALLGKECAVFMPSGIMCNVVAYHIYCGGDSEAEILLDVGSHPIYSGYSGTDVGRPRVRTMDGNRGILSVGAVESAIRRSDADGLRIGVLSLENTHNKGGGSVWSPQELADVATVAQRTNIPVHLDGARLLNAAVAIGASPAAFCTYMDSAWIDLSKALACPSGAVMAGSDSFVAEAQRGKIFFGGGMHKAGILAAAGLYALDHHLERIADDHETAQKLAAGLIQLGYTLNFTDIPTNIVYFDASSRGWSATGLTELLSGHGVLMKAVSADTVRAVTHLGIAPIAVDRALEAIEKVGVCEHASHAAAEPKRPTQRSTRRQDTEKFQEAAG